MTGSVANKETLLQKKQELQRAYEAFKAQGLSLNMARGKPSVEQIRLSDAMQNMTFTEEDYFVNGNDIRSYGMLEGLPQARKLFRICWVFRRKTC